MILCLHDLDLRLSQTKSNDHFLDKIYKITTGFFTENTIVVAEGEMLLEGVFQVSKDILFVSSKYCTCF